MPSSSLDPRYGMVSGAPTSLTPSLGSSSTDPVQQWRDTVKADPALRESISPAAFGDKPTYGANSKWNADTEQWEPYSDIAPWERWLDRGIGQALTMGFGGALGGADAATSGMPDALPGANSLPTGFSDSADVVGGASDMPGVVSGMPDALPNPIGGIDGYPAAAGSSGFSWKDALGLGRTVKKAMSGNNNKDSSGVSDVLGGAASAAQKQKNTEDYLKLALANSQLARDRFAVSAPGARLRTGSQSALDAALAKAGPTTVNWGGPGSGMKGQIPTYGGGVHDALASLKTNPDYMNLLDLVGKDTLAGEKSGGATGGGKDAAMPSYLNDIGKSSLLDKILGGSAFGSSLWTALGKGLGGQSPVASAVSAVAPAAESSIPFLGGGDDLSWLYGDGGLF